MTPDTSNNKFVSRDADLLSNLPVGYFIVDRAGVIIEADKPGASQLGADESYFIKTAFIDRVAWDDRPSFSNYLRRVFENRENMSCEMRMAKLDGSFLRAYISSQLISKEDNKTDRCKLIVTDISSISSLAKLRLREKKFADTLMQNSVDGIVVYDTIFRIVEWNPVMERMTGILHKDCLGKDIFTVFPFLKKIGEERYFKAALEGRKVMSKSKHYFAAKSSREGYFDAYYFPFSDESGNIIFGVGVFRDTTESKKQERELSRAKKLEKMGALASGFAHDYNNLLTGILGNISLAKFYLNSREKAYELIEKASQIVIRARDLTRQLTLQSSDEAPSKKPLPLGPFLKDLLNLSLSGSHIKWSFDFEGRLWLVDIDQSQLWQAINALITYILKTSSEEAILNIRADNAVISSTSSLPLLEGKYLLLAIDQYDPRFDEAITAKNPFSILDSNSKWDSQSSELLIAHNIINNHEGLITVERTDRHSVFNIFLPVTDKTQKVNSSLSVERPVAGKGNILIMDDDDDVREIAAKILKYIGYETSSAKNGDEAIRLYTAGIKSGRPFDVVILDLTIEGGMGGRDTLAGLLEINPAVKAIVSSGHSRDPVMMEFRKYGFKGIIEKPYKIGELSEAVATLLNARD